MLEFNGTFIVLAVSFVIFVILMNFIFYRPMKKVLVERENYINDNENETKENFAKVQKLIDDRDNKISVAKKQSSEILNKTTVASKGKFEVEVQNKKSSIKEQENQLKQDIEQQKTDVQNELKGEVAKFSSEIIAKVLGKDVAVVNISDEMVEKALRGEL